MSDDESLIEQIVAGLKRSKVVVKAQGTDPDTGYRVAARYIVREIELTHEIKKKPPRQWHRTHDTRS